MGTVSKTIVGRNIDQLITWLLIMKNINFKFINNPSDWTHIKFTFGLGTDDTLLYRLSYSTSIS